MFKMIFAFVALFAVVFLGIESWRFATGKERLKFVKSSLYAGGLASVVLVLITIIVLLF